MAIQMRRGNLTDFDPTKMMPGEFAVTLDTDNNLNKRVYITFAAGTAKQLMTVEDATAQMIEATDAATAEAEAWAHGNSFTATEMFTSAGSATVTLAYSPSSINAVKINDAVTTAYTRNGKVITFNTAPAVGSIITVIYGVSTSTDNAKYYKEQAANSASTASTKATQASTSATNAANSASTASTKATQAGNSATLSESYAVGGTGTRPGEDTDNAKYYKDQMAAYLSGIYHFIGSVNKYADLPTMGMVRGDTYDILTADPTHEIAAGDNVAWTGTKWDKLSGTIATMIGATASSNGAKGLVPAPMIADKDNFLRGDGTWANPNTAVDDVYSVMGEMGAKNLIPYPYYESDHTESGITWTVNSDGSVTANGTATANSTFIFRNRTEQTKFVEKNTSYILSGCPSGGSNSKYFLDFFVKNQDDSNVAAGFDYGIGRIIDVPNQDYYGIYAFARVISGQTVSDLTFKPMLRLASDTDDTYQPYAKTNKQLTDDKAEVVSVRDYVNELGVKNLIPYPYYEKSHVDNGITWTDNGDGTVTANGTATATSIFSVVLGNTALSANGNLTINTNKPLILSGCPSGGGNDTYRIQYGLTDGTSYWAKTASDTGSGVELTPVDGLNSYCFDVIRVMVFEGCTVNNLTFKPMLRLASDINDDTYVPFAMTNKQLTERKADISDVPTALSDLDSDSTHRLVTDTEKSSWNGKANWTDVTIPSFTPSQAGWRRICKIKASISGGTGLIYVGGAWSNGQPGSALLAVNMVYSSASLTLLSNNSGNGMIKSIRLVHISSGQYWVDVYFPTYSSTTGPHTLKFTGDIVISDIQNPISITTDTTAATAEISLAQAVSGVVLTDKGDAIIGSSVSLKSYSSATNKYIVPNDGYITVYAGNGTEFNLSLDSARVGFNAMKISSTDGYTRQSIFVKKGIKVYGYPVPISASSYEFDYYPLQ